MKIFTHFFLIFIASTLFVSCKTVPTGNELTPMEIRQLFVGKTVNEEVVTRGEKASTYYSPTGTLHCIVDGASEFYGSWEVNDSGELCVEFGGSKRCRIVVDDNGVYKKYKIKSDGTRKHVVTFKKFSDGDINEFWGESR